MFKVIHITNKAESFANAITTGLGDGQMHFAVTKISAEEAKELIKGQHVVIDIDAEYYATDTSRDLFRNQVGKDLDIPDIEEDELTGQIEDVDYNFDDVILFVDPDYNGKQWSLNYYKVDILI